MWLTKSWCNKIRTFNLTRTFGTREKRKTLSYIVCVIILNYPGTQKTFGRAVADHYHILSRVEYCCIPGVLIR